MTNVKLGPVLSLAITLVVAQAIKLQLTNQLSADNFNRAWMVGSGGLLAGVVVNQLVTEQVIQMLKDTGKYTEEGMVLVSDVCNTLVLLTTQRVFINALDNDPSTELFSFSDAWFRGMFMFMTGVVLFDILVEPQLPDGQYKSLITSIVKRATAVATSDYMADGDFDNLQVNVLSDTGGIIVGDLALSSTPLANMVE